MASRFIEKTLKDHKAMSCRVRIYDDGVIELVSYTTMVLRAVHDDLDDSIYWVEAHGTFWDGYRVFTPTTARHISYFLKEYFPGLSYGDFKYAAEHTGEVLPACLNEEVNLDYGW